MNYIPMNQMIITTITFWSIINLLDEISYNYQILTNIINS